MAGKKKTFTIGAAGFVIAAAVFGALAAQATAPDKPHGADPAATQIAAAPTPLAWNMPAASGEEARDPHLLNAETRRMTAWAALAGLAASAVALFGANRILNFLAGFGKTVSTASAGAARASARVAGTAARSAAKVTGKALKKPGGWLLTVVGLTVFALTGVAMLDIQWEAGLLAGAGMSAAAMWGWRKSGALVERTLAPWRPAPAKAANG